MKIYIQTTCNIRKGLAFFVFAFFSIAVFAAENRDSRMRTLVDPVRVVASSDKVKNAKVLCGHKFGQVPEGKFLAGSGVVLSAGDWIILDFGRELHGSLQIGSGSKSPKSGARARVRFGESVSETCSELIGSTKDATAVNDHAIRDDIVLLPWLGRREIGETGFRFVRIDNPGKDPVHIEYVRAVSLMRPWKAVGSFKSSDERLNAVFDTAVRTVHLCSQDYIWDGIKRDRLVWMGDTHPETMAILAVFGAQDIIPATLDYAAATTPSGAAWMNNMPTYTLWWIRNLAAWYRFTGDKAYVAKHGDYLSKTLEHVLSKIGNDGVWKEDTFLDWPTRRDKKASAAGTQGLLSLALDDAMFLLEALPGGNDRMEALKKKAAAARKRIVPLDTHGVKSASALLALSGLRGSKEMFASSLGRNASSGVSTFYGYYMIEAMAEAGEMRRALDTVRDYWGGMLDMGATSFWEDFNLAWTNNAFRIDEMPVKDKRDIHGGFGAHCYIGFRHSLCHGWSSGPAPFLINRVLGIRPLDAGCKTVEVKPDLGGLEWVEGSMALPSGGCVEVRAWRKADGTVGLDVKAPPEIKLVK